MADFPTTNYGYLRLNMRERCGRGITVDGVRMTCALVRHKVPMGQNPLRHLPYDDPAVLASHYFVPVGHELSIPGGVACSIPGDDGREVYGHMCPCSPTGLFLPGDTLHRCSVCGAEHVTTRTTSEYARNYPWWEDSEDY